MEWRPCIIARSLDSIIRSIFRRIPCVLPCRRTTRKCRFGIAPSPAMVWRCLLKVRNQICSVFLHGPFISFAFSFCTSQIYQIQKRSKFFKVHVFLNFPQRLLVFFFPAMSFCRPQKHWGIYLLGGAQVSISTQALSPYFLRVIIFKLLLPQ